MIPTHKFEFVDLSDLFSLASSYANVEYPEFSTDVIGVLEDFENVSKISTMYGEKDIVKFRITDGRHSSKVTVWGNLAVNTDAAYRATVEQPIIVICSSVKLKTFRTSVQISTLPSSKIYINLDNEVVHAMKQRLDEEGYVTSEKAANSPAQSYTVSAPATVIQTLTLKELSGKTSTDFLKQNFLCKVKVNKVEEADCWWYNGCHKNKCNEEVSKLEGKYRCFKCTRNFPLPQKRYRIVVLAEDDTEAFNFVLLDRAAKRLIGKTATKLIAEGINDNTDKTYPAEIKEISGKEVTLQIELNDDNILLNSNVYHATAAYTAGNANPSKSETIVSGFDSSAFDNTKIIEVQDSGNTPGSATSCTKKIKMENLKES